MSAQQKIQTSQDLEQSHWEIQTIDYQSPTAPRDFAQTLHHTGFAVIRNHPISPEIRQNALKDWQDFFDHSGKESYAYDPKTFIGFYPFASENAKGYSQKNLMEFYHHNLAFPLPKGMTDATNILFVQLMNLGRILVRWLYDGLPAEIAQNFPPLDQLLSDRAPETVMRILNYPPLQDFATEDTRNIAHEDINVITLLSSATAPGLQARDTSGHWHDVGYGTEDLVINAGDMLSMLTKGYYPSTTHRVVNPNPTNNKARYSIPLFVNFKDDLEVRPGLSAKDYLMERLREIGMKKD